MRPSIKLKWQYSGATIPEKRQARRLVLTAYDAVDMSDGVFLVEVLPPGLYNTKLGPDNLRKAPSPGFVTIATSADMHYYPYGYFSTVERDAIPMSQRVSDMLVYVANENVVYRLGSGLTNNDWLVYDPCKQGGLPVNLEQNTWRYFRVPSVDFVIPPNTPIEEVVNYARSRLDRLCIALKDMEDLIDGGEFEVKPCGV